MRASAATTQAKEGAAVKSRQWLAVVPLTAALAMGVAACGSSNNSTSSSSGSGGSVNATLNGAGSAFAAPITRQCGSTVRGQGLRINSQSVGWGAGVPQSPAGPVDLGASDPPLKPEE